MNFNMNFTPHGSYLLVLRIYDYCHTYNGMSDVTKLNVLFTSMIVKNLRLKMT